MSGQLAQLLATPDGYLHSFEGDEAILVPMDRSAYARSTFLDRRISTAREGGWRVPLAELAGVVPAPQSMRWIFHVAHCGSTLLANTLQALTGDLVLREPLALRQVALETDPERLRIALALLSRRYPGQGRVTVKANVPVNFMLDALAAAQPEASAIFLHLELEDYLLAILRSPNHRAWLRNVTGMLATHLGDLSALEDCELGAALWLEMRRRYVAALAHMPNGRSLDAELFFAEPHLVLSAVAGLFGLDADAGRISAVVDGPLYSSYSKNPALAFDNSARLARREALAVDLATEIGQARRWIETNGTDADEIDRQIADKRLVA